MQTIAIIGAGFSGTMLAVHLLQAGCPTPTTVVLIERTGRFTAGVAYGTPCPRHLLNVPAGRMSAFDNDPEHFLRWARARDHTIGGSTFVHRRMYGQYLADVLDDAEMAAHPSVRLLRVPGEARSLSRGFDHRMTIDLGGGGNVRADRVVLAIGNFPPADPAEIDPAAVAARRYVRDPWEADALNISREADVLLIGTGLTMLDIAIGLADRGHRGPMYAISRRGLLPQPHRHGVVPPPHHQRPADIDRWPATVRGQLHAIRREVQQAAAQGVDWREVITSIRADTTALWMKLPAAERARFLRHLRPFWETHRHRAAPRIAAEVHRMTCQKQLVVIAGRVRRVSATAAEAGATVTLRRRGACADEMMRVDCIINCSGPDTNLARVTDPLISSLRDLGLIRPDPLGLGLDSAADGAVISADGRSCDRVYVAGPLRKGRLWENTAVPELRVEAWKLALRLSKRSGSRRSLSSMRAAHSLQC